MSESKDTTLGWLALLLLWGAVYVVSRGYEWLDSIGRVSHKEDTVITARSDWLVGETKECASSTLNSEGAKFLEKPVGYAVSSIACDDGQEHKMPVTFYGRKVQSEYKYLTWRCTRNDVSFTCYQTGGQ